MASRYLCCLFLGLWACAPPAVTKPVATVGGRSIQEANLIRAAQSMYGAQGPLSPAQEDAVLNALVATQLLVLEGLAQGLDRADGVKEPLEKLEGSLLREQFYQRSVWAGLVISEEAIGALYKEWGQGQQLRLAHILCPEKEEIQQVLTALEKGEAFALLARQHSRHLDSSPGGGDMGYLPRHGILPEVAAVVWEAPVGYRHPEPILTRLGYHVVEVRERRQLTMEQQRVALVRHLEREGKVAREKAALAGLEEKYQLRRQPRIAGLMAQRRELPPVQILYHWQGGQLSAADYVRRAPAAQPVFSDSNRIDKMAHGLVVEDLIKLEARALGYDQLEEVRQPLQRKLEELLGRALFEQVAAQNAPSDEEMQQFYQAHRDQYRQSPGLTIREILVAERALADSLYALVQAGAAMDELARRFTRRNDMRDSGGLWRNVPPGDPRSAKLYRLAMAREGLLEPIEVPGGYAVVKVVDKAPGQPLEFAEAAESIGRDLAILAMDAFIDQLRQRYADQIEIRSDWRDLI
ncbi:MAG: hypothetical protein GKR89_35305 [Candidatus Latescibacteria bacterium]|nr:hypothetical protein [Candidatus Latescibacterota bacterium]